MNILLDENDFEKLISGKIIEKGEHKIALQDIGYIKMCSLVYEKYLELLAYKEQ